jgi:uncharacterized protein YuzE
VSRFFAVPAAALAFGAFFALSNPAAVAQMSAPSTMPTTGVENPAVTARAKDVLHQLQTNTLDRSQFSNDFNKELTTQELARAGTQLASFGDAQQFTYDSQLTRGAETAYLYHVRLEHGQLDEIIAVDQDGKISGLLFRNARLTTTPGGGSSVNPPARSPNP